MSSALMAFLHHGAAFVLVAALAVEHMLFDPKPTLAAARRLMRIDMVYGASAGMLLLVGFLRAAHFEKGWEYYAGNPWFLGKLAVFALVGLLSAYPTVVFFSWRRAVKAGKAPEVPAHKARTIALLMRTQLVLVIGILLCAAFMAKGIA
jgi:putative membrane protein